MSKRKMDQMDLAGNNTDPAKKREPMGEKWYATVNNWTEEQWDQLDQLFTDHHDIKMAVMGKEVGESGTPHLQCYIEFNKRMRPRESKIFKDLGTAIHWGDKFGRPCKKTMPTYVGINYCSKDGDYKCYNCTKPRDLVKLKKEDLRPWQAEIAGWFDEYEDPLFGRTIHWVWEPAGNIGKTVLATYLFDSGEDVAVVSGAKKDMKYAVCEMVKNGIMPKLIVLDIPRVNKEHFSIAGIEEIKNGFFMSEKFESGFCRYNRPWVIGFANCRPDVTKMSMDRYKVYQLVNGELVREIPTMDPISNDIEWAHEGSPDPSGGQIEGGEAARGMLGLVACPASEDDVAMNG